MGKPWWRFWPVRGYVGTVSSWTLYLDENDDIIPGGVKEGGWILTDHPLLGRRAIMVGGAGTSEAAVTAKKQVKAWEAGGALPELDEDTQHRGPTPIIHLVVDNSSSKADDL